MAKPYKQLREQVRSDPARVARVEAHRREMERELTLRELRKARSLTQETLARTLDTNQSGVSRIERQTDLYLSTLRSYVEALGGRLELHAVFPDDDAIVTIGELEGEEATVEDHLARA
jgi:transcriptional regulator with XRE-family HTH domain